MKRHIKCILSMCIMITIVVSLSFGFAMAQNTDKKDVNVTTLDKVLKARGRITPSERQAAAKRNAQLGLQVGTTKTATPGTETTPVSVQGDEKPDQTLDQKK